MNKDLRLHINQYPYTCLYKHHNVICIIDILTYSYTFAKMRCFLHLTKMRCCSQLRQIGVSLYRLPVYAGIKRLPGSVSLDLLKTVAVDTLAHTWVSSQPWRKVADLSTHSWPRRGASLLSRTRVKSVSSGITAPGESPVKPQSPFFLDWRAQLRYNIWTGEFWVYTIHIYSRQWLRLVNGLIHGHVWKFECCDSVGPQVQQSFVSNQAWVLYHSEVYSTLGPGSPARWSCKLACWR